MKELYFTSTYRRSLRTIRLQYGQVKKVLYSEPMMEKSTVEGNLIFNVTTSKLFEIPT